MATSRKKLAVGVEVSLSGDPKGPRWVSDSGSLLWQRGRGAAAAGLAECGKPVDVSNALRSSRTSRRSWRSCQAISGSCVDLTRAPTFRHHLARAPGPGAGRRGPAPATRRRSRAPRHLPWVGGEEITIFYTHSEGGAIERFYRAVDEGVEGPAMNPAGFLFAGHALRDCPRAVPLPCVEIHMTNIDKRGFRSIVAEATAGTNPGFSVQSYIPGLEGMLRHLSGRREAGSGPPRKRGRSRAGRSRGGRRALV